MSFQLSIVVWQYNNKSIFKEICHHLHLYCVVILIYWVLLHNSNAENVYVNVFALLHYIVSLEVQ